MRNPDLAYSASDRLSGAYLLLNLYALVSATGTHDLPTSTALGVHLPDLVRNDGNIARGKLNVQQSQIQVTSMEQKVISEVTKVHGECARSKSELSRIEDEALAVAARRCAAAGRDYLARPAPASRR